MINPTQEDVVGGHVERLRGQQNREDEGWRVTIGDRHDFVVSYVVDSGGRCSFLFNPTLSHFSLHRRKMMARRRRMARPRGAGWRDWWARRGVGGMVGLER